MNADVVDEDDDELIPDPEVRRIIGKVSEMTTWRWDRDPKMAALGWPPPIYIRKRKYRSGRGIKAFREARVRQAIAERDQRAA